MAAKTKRKRKRSPNSLPVQLPTEREAMAAALLALDPTLVLALTVLEEQIDGYRSELESRPKRPISNGDSQIRRACTTSIGALSIARDKIARAYMGDTATQVLAVRSINLRARRIFTDPRIGSMKFTEPPQ